LPVDRKLNAATIRNHLGKVACQVDNELIRSPLNNGEGRFGEQDLVAAEPQNPIVMGVDGGYLRDWAQKKTYFDGAARAGDCWQICSHRPAC